MPVNVKITAEVADLQAKFAVARAESSSLTAELNKLAREAANNNSFDQLRPKLDAAAEKMNEAKQRAAELKSQLDEGRDGWGRYSEAVNLAKEALGAFGVGISVGSVIEFGKSVLDSAAELAHQADVLDLSVAQLQAFTESAKLAGVATDTVEGAIRRFNAAQGQAQLGTTEQAKAFNDLGVSATLPATEALPAVAKALLSITDTARRTRDEVILFGRSGAELQPALLEWARGTDVLEKSIQDLGLALNPGDAAAAKAAETQFQTTFDRMKADWTPAVVTMGTGLATLADWLAKAGAAAGYILPEFATLSELMKQGREGAGFNAPFAGPDSLAIARGGAAPPPNFTAPGAGGGTKEVDQTRQIEEAKLQIWEQTSIQRIDGEEHTNESLLRQGQLNLEQFVQLQTNLENARYQVESGALQQREALDKDNAVAFARDKADEELIAVEHENRLTAIADKAAEDRIAAAREDARREAEAREQGFKDQYDSYSRWSQQFIAGTQADEQFYRNQMRLEVEARRQAMQEIDAVESQLVRGIISGRQSAAQIAGQLAETLLEKELTADLEYLTQHELVNLGVLTSDQLTAQEGLLAKLAGWAAEKLGFTTSEAAKKAVEGPANATTAESNAAVAATGAAASVASVPYIGPALAVAAAAETFASLQPFVGLAALATGTNYVPQTGLYTLHEGEVVTPKAYVPDGRGGTGGSDTHFNINNAFHLNGGASLDFASQLRDHIVGVFTDLVRGGYLKLA